MDCSAVNGRVFVHSSIKGHSTTSFIRVSTCLHRTTGVTPLFLFPTFPLKTILSSFTFKHLLFPYSLSLYPTYKRSASVPILLMSLTYHDPLQIHSCSSELHVFFFLPPVLCPDFSPPLLPSLLPSLIPLLTSFIPFYA